jgi:transmembrane sensor
MEITNDLIQKFFENKCDPEEFEAVTHYLESHPEEKASRMGWEEWNAIGISQAISNDNDNDDQAAALQQLKERLFRRSLIRRLTIPAVAASLLLAIGGIWMIAKRANDKDMTGRTAGHPSAPARIAWNERNNTTGKPKIVTMPDGSEIKLFAHSSLRYPDSFGIGRRDVWLDGTADFSVKKDKGHPFTVISGSLATTVLGTSFGIKAPAADGMFTLRLFTGRVVVRPVKTLPGWNKDIYLSPGQQLLYNDRLMLATVNRFRKE